MAESSGKSPRGRKVRPVRGASELRGRSGERTLSAEMASHEKRVVGYRAAEPDSRMGEGQWTLPKQRARAGGVCSGAWVVAPAEWSVTQSREGLTAARPEAQARDGEAEGDPETGGSGRSSGDARDNTTLAEQRTRGTAAYAPKCPCGLTGNGGRVAEGAPRARQTRLWRGRALPGGTCGPAVLKPYWGKPAVPNFRGAR
jgi:hypothetical protein